jgi:hypothetical protein
MRSSQPASPQLTSVPSAFVFHTAVPVASTTGERKATRFAEPREPKGYTELWRVANLMTLITTTVLPSTATASYARGQELRIGMVGKKDCTITCLATRSRSQLKCKQFLHTWPFAISKRT